jgi:hypothetical protein
MDQRKEALTMISSILDRIEQHTKPEINKRIHKQMDRNIDYYQQHKEEIGQRIEELQNEWTTDRVFLTAGGAMALSSAILTTATNNRRFAVMSAVAGSFLLMYSIAGWAPPLALLRRLGIRTSSEVDDERCALALQTRERG